MVFEQLMRSKIRAHLIEHFLTESDQKFYLRQLERLLDEPLTPLRRELIHLKEIGFLSEQPQGNLKLYQVNPDFEHMEELKKIVCPAVESKAVIEEPAVEVVPQSTPISQEQIAWTITGLVSVILVSLLVVQLGLKEPAVQPVAENIHDKSLQEIPEVAYKATATTAGKDMSMMSSNKIRLEFGGFGGVQ